MKAISNPVTALYLKIKKSSQIKKRNLIPGLEPFSQAWQVTVIKQILDLRMSLIRPNSITVSHRQDLLFASLFLWCAKDSGCSSESSNTFWLDEKKKYVLWRKHKGEW